MPVKYTNTTKALFQRSTIFNEDESFSLSVLRNAKTNLLWCNYFNL